MSFEKYLHLKSKYNCLKKKIKLLKKSNIGGSPNEENQNSLREKNIKILDNLYNGKTGYINHKNITGYNLTYGELTYNGLKTICDELQDKFKDGIRLLDMGSGVGKIPIMGVLFFSFQKATGVEFVPERHKIAISILDKLDKETKNKIQFIHEDIFDISDEELSKYNLIFISNLCFTTDINDKLYNRLKNVNENTIIILSKKFSNNEVFAMNEIKNIEMSWSKSCLMYTYQKKSDSQTTANQKQGTN